MAVEGREEEAWQRYEALPPPLREAPIVLEEVSILQMRQGDCEAGLAILERAHDGHVPIHGQVPPNMPRSNANLAANRVFCLRQLGRSEEAEAILAQLRPYIESLKATAPGGQEMLAIKLDILDGMLESAMGRLEAAVRQRHLGFRVWGDPMVKSLEDKPGYKELRKWLEATVNTEREELGWPPETF
jgi:hypothetical protein